MSVYSHPAWRTVRRYVLDRDGFRCQVRLPGCTGTATCADHIVPLALGGHPFDPTNLRGSCGHCNAARAAAATNEQRASRRRAAPSGIFS